MRETTQTSTDGGMNKQNVVYTRGGILFSLKKEWDSDSCYSMDELENMLSEIKQTQNDKHYSIPLKRGTQNRQIHKNTK